MLTAKEKVPPGAGIGNPSPTDALLNPQEKPRGFLNFLTSPFALSQLFSTRQLVNEMVAPALTADESKSGQSNAGQSNVSLQNLEDARSQGLQSLGKTGAVELAAQPNDPTLLGTGA